MRIFARFLWGMLAVAELLFGYKAGAEECNLTMTGQVQIKVEETKGQDIRAEARPGERIRKSAWITVEKSSKKVQIRLKLLADGLMAAQQKDLFQNIEAGKEWIYCEENGYFYSKKTLGEGEKIYFQAEIVIPEKWKALKRDLCFRLELVADAVHKTYY